MKKYLLIVLLFLFIFSIPASAQNLNNQIKPPFDNKTIRYQYYLEAISRMPEFKNDSLLPFEREMNRKAFEREVKKASSRYLDVLNFIDKKSSCEIVIYANFIDELKKCLASKGIFPSRFDDMKIASDSYYNNIFTEFSYDFDGSEEYSARIPETVKNSRRIYFYLRSFFRHEKNTRELKKIYSLMMKSLEKEDNPIAAAYKKAVIKLDEAYSKYIDGDFINSSTLYGEAIELWIVYWKLSNGSNELTEDQKYDNGMLLLTQGTILADAKNYDAAADLYYKAGKIFEATQESTDYAVFAKIFISEILYRLGDIKGFTNLIESLDKKALSRVIKDNTGNNYVYSSTMLLVKCQVIIFEYQRVSNPAGYHDEQERKTINDRITGFCETSPGMEGGFMKASIQRYKEIMDKNKIEIRSISFTEPPGSQPTILDKASGEPDFFITLKDHEKNSIITSPEWKIEASGSNFIVKQEKIAIVRNKKIYLKIYFNAPLLEYLKSGKLNGEATFYNQKGEKKEIKFSQIGPLPPTDPYGNYGVYVVSDDTIYDRVDILAAEIDWCLEVKQKKAGRDYIDKFFLNRTYHKIYCVRNFIPDTQKNPCYWQIVEYTCNWLSILGPDDLSDQNEKKVLYAIWEGCSINNLNALKYKYVYPLSTSDDNYNLRYLLQNKEGDCGLWAKFFRHCLFTQTIINREGLEAYGDTIDFMLPERITNEKDSQVFIYKTKAIGNVNPMFFSDHSIVGYGGKKGTDPNFNTGVEVYIGGEIFDVVFHIHTNNIQTYEYEKKAVEKIKPTILSTTEIIINPDDNTKKFVLQWVQSGIPKFYNNFIE